MTANDEHDLLASISQSVHHHESEILAESYGLTPVNKNIQSKVITIAASRGAGVEGSGRASSFELIDELSREVPPQQTAGQASIRTQELIGVDSSDEFMEWYRTANDDLRIPIRTSPTGPWTTSFRPPCSSPTPSDREALRGTNHIPCSYYLLSCVSILIAISECITGIVTLDNSTRLFSILVPVVVVVYHLSVLVSAYRLQNPILLCRDEWLIVRGGMAGLLAFPCFLHLFWVDLFDSTMEHHKAIFLPVTLLILSLMQGGVLVTFALRCYLRSREYYTGNPRALWYDI